MYFWFHVPRLESEKGPRREKRERFCPHNYKVREEEAKLENREKFYEITPCLAVPASIRHALWPFRYAAVAPDPQAPIAPPQVKPEPAVQV
jgi:hypothetical protein